MPKLNREENGARTRSLLIEAARREIVKKGFATASIRDIAETAGFSLGAIYSNFPDKEAILLELIQQHQSEERKRIEAALTRANGEAASAMAGIEKWAETVNSALISACWRSSCNCTHCAALRSPKSITR